MEPTAPPGRWRRNVGEASGVRRLPRRTESPAIDEVPLGSLDHDPVLVPQDVVGSPWGRQPFPMILHRLKQPSVVRIKRVLGTDVLGALVAHFPLRRNLNGNAQE